MLRPNVISIVGGLLAVLSPVFPWWTVMVTFEFMGIGRSAYMSLYLSWADTDAMGWSRSSHLDLWFGWVTLALVVSAGLFGVAGGLLRRTRMVLLGGCCSIAALTVFVAALQSELLSGPVVPWGFIINGMFSSGTIDRGYVSSTSYRAYLSLGFWIALTATILLLVSAKYHK